MRITRKRASEIIGPGAATSNQPLFGAFRAGSASRSAIRTSAAKQESTDAPDPRFGAHTHRHARRAKLRALRRRGSSGSS